MKKETIIATITGIMLLAAWITTIMVVIPWLFGMMHGWSGGICLGIVMMLLFITIGWVEEFFPGA